MMSITRVVNLRTDSYDVYIGRGGRGKDGLFGNPYVVGEQCMRCRERHLDAAGVIPCFKGYFESRLLYEPQFRELVHNLLGKTLGCFCKPGPCHGDVIVEYLEKQYRPSLIPR